MAVKVMVAPAIVARAEAPTDEEAPRPAGSPQAEAAQVVRLRRRRARGPDHADVPQVPPDAPALPVRAAPHGHGSIRNQPGCRGCRSVAGADKPRRREQEEGAIEGEQLSTPESALETAPEPKRPIDAGRMSAQIAAALAGGWRR